MARRAVPVNGWTPTQKRIIDLLSDLEPHPFRECLQCLNIPDDIDAKGVLQFHISTMRDKLRQHRIDIACVFHRRRLCYRLYRKFAEQE